MRKLNQFQRFDFNAFQTGKTFMIQSVKYNDKKECVSYVDGRKKGTTHNSNQNIFTSKLVCAYCGKNYVRRIVHHGTKNQKAIWHCTTYCKEGKANCPNCKSVDEEYLKMSIVGKIKNLIDDDNSMFYLTNDLVLL